MAMVKLIFSYLIENIYQFYKKYLKNLNKTQILLVENEAPNRKNVRKKLLRTFSGQIGA